jgi:hypothetical protein
MLEQKAKEANAGGRGFIYMVAYEFFTYDEKNGYELVGILPERRNDPNRITKESVLNWGRMIFGNNADGKNIFFKCTTIDDVSDETVEASPPFNNY